MDADDDQIRQQRKKLPDGMSDWFASLPAPPSEFKLFPEDLAESEADVKAILGPTDDKPETTPPAETRRISGASEDLTTESDAKEGLTSG